MENNCQSFCKPNEERVALNKLALEGSFTLWKFVAQTPQERLWLSNRMSLPLSP
jgi:hypothetical protein